MYKRIISLFLTVLILAGISVISTSAATNYTLWVGGVQVTSNNASDVLGDGTVRYVAKESCLYLNNANIKGVTLIEDVMSAGIYAGGMDLTVRFSGDNKVTDAGGNDWSIGVGVDEGNLTFIQEGDSSTLEIYSGYAKTYTTGVYVTCNYNDVTQGGDLLIESGDIKIGYTGKILSEGTGVGIYCSSIVMKKGNVEAVGAPSESGDSLGAEVYGLVSVREGNFVAKGSEGVSSIGLFSDIVYYIDEDMGDYVSEGGGYIYVYENASVTALASEAKTHSIGMSLTLGMSCWGNITATGADTTATPGPDVNTTSYGIVVWDVSGLNLEDGKITALAGYAYDSCGMNLIADTEDVPVNRLTIKNTDVTAVSKGGYMYSDGLYAGIDTISIYSGSLTASGGPVTAGSEYYPESGGIFAEGIIYVVGGVLKASSTEVTQENGSDIALYASGGIDIEDYMELKGGELVEGDEGSYIMQKSFDTPVVIRKIGYVEIGDVNADGDINIKDATAIQKHIAKIELLDEQAYKLADFNCDEYVSIKDATAIQKHIAGLPY